MTRFLPIDWPIDWPWFRPVSKHSLWHWFEKVSHLSHFLYEAYTSNTYHLSLVISSGASARSVNILAYGNW